MTADKHGHAGIYHEVKAGQTLWSIARAYGTDVQSLARVNAVSDVTSLHVGQKLYVPGATQRREIASHCPCGTDTPTPAVSATPLVDTFRPAERTSASKTAATLASLPQGASLESLGLIWPVQGAVARGFEQDAARRHDGIDIVAPEGTPIHAAADGEVIFSDWGPGGYGRIVIVQHRPHVVTVYAHNHANLVRPGQRVRQGELIATVGQSGRATASHVHFEVRYKAVPIAPYRLLPRRPGNVVALDRS